ncbi:MAG: hypothetical protein WC554_10660 [Clostridia bacterium]|jgi:hypothetical protein
MSLLNQSAVHDYIVEQVKAKRLGWNCTQVASSTYEVLEFKLKKIIDAAVHAHPTLGKTFKEIL